MGNFKILHSSNSVANRPRVSFKIREYFEEFAKNNIIKKNNIILNSKYDVHLVVVFNVLEFSNSWEFELMKPHVFSGEKVKQYTLFVNFNTVDYGDEVIEPYCLFMFEVLKCFFTLEYKRIKPDSIEKLRNHLDYDYLSSFSYPASFEEQKFVLDDSPHVRQAYFDVYK